MAGEIVDYFLIFWVVLAAAVFGIGNIYEKQLREKRRKIQEQEAKRRRLEEDPWAPSASARSTYDQSSSAYQSSAPNYSTNQAYQHHQPTSTSNHLNDLGSPSASYLPAGASSQYQDYASNQYQQVPPSGGGQYDYESSRAFDDDYDESGTSLGRRVRRATDFLDSQDPGLATIPTASGFNADCVEWVNSILYLFYTQADKYGPIIGENIYRSLNEKLSNLISTSSEHSHLLVEFEGVNVNASSRPELTNVRTESESDKSVSATCKIYNRKISMNLAIKRLHGSSSGGSSSGAARSSAAYGADDEQQVMRYELVLENLEGKLKSMAMLNEKLIVIQFIEKPDTKILLRPLTIIRLGRSVPREPLISEDALVQIILQTLTQVVVDLYFGNDLDFPQYRQHHSAAASTYANYKNKLNNLFKGSTSELKRQLKQHDLFGALSSSAEKERKVFVKIIRARNLNYNQSVTCLMELETPKQQAISSTKQGTSNPYWDEHFLFSVTDRSGELSFELWDSISPQAAAALSATATANQAPDTPTSSLKRNSSPIRKWGSNKNDKWHKGELVAGATFLGVARVSVEELRRNPIQKVSLPLEPIASDLSNSVGGELELELLFMEHSAGAAAAQQSGAVATGAQETSTGAAGHSTSGPLHKSNSLGSLAYHHGDIVSIDRKLTPSGFVITTTTITKAPGGAPAAAKQPLGQLIVRNQQSPVGSSSMNTELTGAFDDGSQFEGAPGGASGSPAGGRGLPDGRSELGADSSTAGGRASRSRSRSRSFIRAIKKRFSFSRTRSRSVGESGAESPRLPSGNTLEAADYESRSRASSEVSALGDSMGGMRAKSMPASRDPSEVPTIVINKGRLSDTAAGMFTFAQPKSQLVIEVLEPGLREEGQDTPRDHYRYYAVPDDAASQKKWRRRGLKLHVFNEHQFVACHLAGSSTCHLCGRVFSRRPGKQGYKCRNCHLLSHKECHVKVDHNCPYAQRDGLRLEYIDADPPASLVDEMMLNSNLENNDNDDDANLSSATLPRQQNRQARKTRPSRSAGLKSSAKSISVDVDDR